MRLHLRSSLTLLFALLACVTQAAEPQTQFSHLSAGDYHTGTSKFLVYTEDKDGNLFRPMALWYRTTSIEDYQGQPHVKITQHWKSTDKKQVRDIVSYNRISDFAPVYQTISNPERGTAAFVFSDDMIAGDKTLTNNKVADFSMAASNGTLNWELDIETFALLDLQQGKTFNLNFYHPGSKTPPSLYQYKVIGSEKIANADGSVSDCWMLKIDYNKDAFATFWLSKDSHQLMKMEEIWQGIKRYKVRLPADY
ncbi:hypothetical protein [Neptunicella marina]|uniref:DUF3108 domain-containing protein n=1 Tax=Neptunicella marina TaxID=2125989 RepID=A0A8J6IXJ2_9ALTE|nr:hypothetical protein [Neptunicella marina]MBC3767053.1 hypothetical protein [Neptunicella marina]